MVDNSVESAELLPVDMNLPESFAGFRVGQLEIITRLLASDKRVSMVEAPTGSGKTLLGMALAANWPDRSVILTATKGLQDQINADFGQMEGFYDVRGQANYPCVELYKQQNIIDQEIELQPVIANKGCDNGPCKTGWRCPLKESGCYYYDAWDRACYSRIISTNYAYWMGITAYGRGLGTDKIGLLVLDEGHDADKMIRNFMSVSLGWQRVQKISIQLGMQYPQSIGLDHRLWVEWAREAATRMQIKLEIAAQGGSDTDMSDMRENCNRCGRLALCRDDWWFEAHETYGIKAAPSVIDRYSEKYLFQGINRIIIMSGTLHPETARILGVKDDDMEYIQVPSTFPVNRRPIYSVPTIVANFKATESDWRTWLNRIDTIIRDRQDRKGIIHTVSYQRARWLKANSRFSEIMLLHESGEVQQAVEQFKAHSAPLVLLSPSIVTGFDFKDDYCRYQIMAKLPFPDTRYGPEGVLNKRIKGYTNLVVAMLLSQAYGRGVRDMDDWCEFFILDDSFSKWWLRKAYHLLSRYVLEAIRKVETVPCPLNL